ncbi:hypothetical protein HOH45_03060, partial [bacterium]|nr:hypothetical protein [bacterium]
LLISQLIQYLSITTCTLPISNIIFCGLRFSYSSSEIDTLKSGLRLNKKKQLKQFYRACFHSPQEYKLFFNDLGKRYLSLFESTLLLTGLTYLEKYQCLDEQGLTELTASISPTRVRFQLFQGSFDLIAPLTKLEAKTNDADHKSTRCDSFQLYKFETGHIPFFNETSCNRLSDVFDRLKHPN